MSNIEVVDMTYEHIDGVMAVEKLSFKIPWSRNAFIEEITKNKFAIYFTARINGMIAGYAGMWKVFDEGHITNIAVHPEFRRNGVGSALLEKLIERAKAEGITKMTLEVRKSNYAAQKLYSKYGFLDGGVRKAYYSDNNEDAIIMWKENQQ
ncbi:MAG: ribosomal protein S18-alanine N-acetyltransferase [Clostridia bacterium]|nr:ribosomal protein S18-alanine N-acetyltransferase [Clostridia bacterium]